jgi:hypothetical protein
MSAPLTEIGHAHMPVTARAGVKVPVPPLSSVLVLHRPQDGSPPARAPIPPSGPRPHCVSDVVDLLRFWLSLRSRVFGDTAHNCTPTRAQREKKPGLAVPAEVENIGATLLCVLQDELNSSTSSLPRAQRFRQKWRQNAQHYAYCSGGFVLSSATGDVTLEALPVVNQNQLHACWKMAETGLLDSLGIPP